MNLVKIILLSSLIFISFKVKALRVVTFNTMCDICAKKEFNYPKYKYRKNHIVDTLRRLDGDIVALQEVRASRQLKRIKRKLGNYNLYYSKFKIFKFADPAILLRKDRFIVLDKGGRWLGPKGDRRFSLGWKLALPRRLFWLHVYDKKIDREYIIATSHFDNRKANKEPSSEVVTNLFRDKKIPVIFAADTNLRPSMLGYENLNEVFVDSFDIKDQFTILRNVPTSIHDGCNIEKDTVFPDCRVDHIFLSRNDNWRVSNWIIDHHKYPKSFTSDHRAIAADIEFE